MPTPGWMEVAGVTSASELDQLIEEQHVALDAFVKGNDQPLANLWSRADDVTLGNPFGPFARGSGKVAETLKAAAAFYADGEATGFELLSKHVTADLAYIVEVERFTAQFVGGMTSRLCPCVAPASSVEKTDAGGSCIATRIPSRPRERLNH